MTKPNEPAKKESPSPSPRPIQTGFSPQTPLVRELLALSDRARAEGLVPCGNEEIMAEIAARRAGG